MVFDVERVPKDAKSGVGYPVPEERWPRSSLSARRSFSAYSAIEAFLLCGAQCTQVRVITPQFVDSFDLIPGQRPVIGSAGILLHLLRVAGARNHGRDCRVRQNKLQCPLAEGGGVSRRNISQFLQTFGAG